MPSQDSGEDAMSYITFENVCKDYPAGDSVVHAADHVSFGIEKRKAGS